MTSFRRNNRRSHTALFGVLVVLVVGILAWLWLPGVVRSTVATMSRPVLAFRASASEHIARLSHTTKTKEELVEENRTLREELEKLRLLVADREVLKSENTKLKELVGYTDTESRIVARVLARPPETVYGTMLIDLGSYGGIQKEARVYAGANVVLGIVDETFPRMSRVRMYTRGGNTFDVAFAGVPGVVTATGQGSSNFTARVPEDMPVAVGDTVHLAGETSVIGYVGGIEHIEGETLKTVLMRSPVGLSGIDFVSVGQ